MKRYKLLKDLPFAKAGEELYLKFSEDSEFFLVYKDTDKTYTAELNPEFIDNFDEWFEEIKEYYVINSVFGEILKTNDNSHSDLQIRTMRELGVLFDTWLEADEKLAYLKAKAVIKQDTKGFKPNWNETEQIKYSCFYDEDRFTGNRCVKPVIEKTSTKMGALIYFKSEEDIKESLKKHPEEWRKYLFYEQ
jgi:hypothetical protein